MTTTPTPAASSTQGVVPLLDQGTLSDGTPYVVRLLEESDIPAVQDLDRRIEANLTVLDKRFFYAHDQAWYESHLRSGNKIVGMFNTASGALVSKANLTVDCNQLNPAGLNATSALRKTYAGQFGKTGMVALLSGIGTDYACRGRGAQSILLKSLFSHAVNDCGKFVMAAIVEPRNISSLSVLLRSGMGARELNTHPIQKADYFLLSGFLYQMRRHQPLQIDPADLKTLNGSVDELRTKIKNNETRIAAPLDIEDIYANNLYNSENASLISYAFRMGYTGVQVLHNPEYDPQDPSKGTKDYLIMDLHH